MTKEDILVLLERYCKKLRITPVWDVKLEFVEDASFRKPGDVKIDCRQKGNSAFEHCKPKAGKFRRGYRA